MKFLKLQAYFSAGCSAARQSVPAESAKIRVRVAFMARFLGGMGPLRAGLTVGGLAEGVMSVHLAALRGRWGREAAIEVEQGHLVVVGHAARDLAVDELVRWDDRAELLERPHGRCGAEDGETLLLRAVKGGPPCHAEPARRGRLGHRGDRGGRRALRAEREGAHGHAAR